MMSHKNKQKACKQPDISDPHAAHRPNCHHGHAEEIRPESADAITNSLHYGLTRDAWALSIYADEIFPNEDLGL
ncbi:MAG: hypothetical protein RR989_08950 [Ruthenibacterium sp.]